MADITQTTTGESVTFVPNSTRAGRWMSLRYGNHAVAFLPLQEPEAVREFIRAAEGQGLSIAES